MVLIIIIKFSLLSISLTAPDDGPQNFASTPTMTTVTFTWSRPSTPNGIITGYQLKVANTDKNNNTVHNIPVSPDQTDITYTVDVEGFFRAYERYTATVTASTIIGFGPIATTSGRTLPDSELLSLSLSPF